MPSRGPGHRDKLRSEEFLSLWSSAALLIGNVWKVTVLQMTEVNDDQGVGDDRCG